MTELKDRAGARVPEENAREITADEKAAIRAIVFTHLRGIVLAPVARALCDRGVFDLFRDSAWVDLDQISQRTRANHGYLRVGLRLLVSSGWLKWRNGESGAASYALTPEGSIALGVAPEFYREVVSFIPMAIFLEDFLFGKSQGSFLPSLQVLIDKAIAGWGIAIPVDPVAVNMHAQLRLQLDGMLIGPAMVALARNGIFDKLVLGPAELKSMDGNQSCLSSLFDLLASQGWVTREQNRISLTPRGRYAAQIAPAYGVTVSYLPMFSVVSTLMFGNPRIPRVDESGVELLVNRAMNVWGSGGAHATYFNRVDEIVIEIFNRPIELQPSGVCDMGCGNGRFLEHVYQVVKERTARGKVLDKYPLLIVGADFNKVARRVTKQNFKKAQIPNSHVIHGDINRPALLAGDLEEIGVDIHDLLHMRSFLDHNRPYLQPSGYVRGTRKGRSTGAFAHLGDEILADELEENLVRHLRRWAPYVGRFGLLVLELHTIAPELAAGNPKKTPAVAYDGTHGFSDQYLVEVPVFLECAREAGLHTDARYQAQFPPSELATVSINFFTAPQA
jgi:SAM-dependent methyltransferase